MKAIDVNYQLTFKDKFFREKKKMNEVKDILKTAFEKMIDHVKKNLRPGDIMRAAIHNENLDLPIYVPCRPMEEMDAETIMESLTSVLNSNQNLAFDSTCRINVGAIKYPRGGKGRKMASIQATVLQKRAVVQILNSDYLCLMRAALVAYSSVCKTSNDDYKKMKALYPTLSPSEILIQFEKCPTWYWKKIRDNEHRSQDNLVRDVCLTIGISDDQPLTYALIPRLEDYLYVNIYVVSSAHGNAFSYVNSSGD